MVKAPKRGRTKRTPGSEQPERSARSSIAVKTEDGEYDEARVVEATARLPLDLFTVPGRVSTENFFSTLAQNAEDGEEAYEDQEQPNTGVKPQKRKKNNKARRKSRRNSAKPELTLTTTSSDDASETFLTTAIPPEAGSKAWLTSVASLSRSGKVKAHTDAMERLATRGQAIRRVLSTVKTDDTKADGVRSSLLAIAESLSSVVQSALEVELHWFCGREQQTAPKCPLPKVIERQLKKCPTGFSHEYGDNCLGICIDIGIATKNRFLRDCFGREVCEKYLEATNTHKRTFVDTVRNLITAFEGKLDGNTPTSDSANSDARQTARSLTDALAKYRSHCEETARALGHPKLAELDFETHCQCAETKLCGGYSQWYPNFLHHDASVMGQCRPGLYCSTEVRRCMAEVEKLRHDHNLEFTSNQSSDG